MTDIETWLSVYPTLRAIVGRCYRDCAVVELREGGYTLARGEGPTFEAAVTDASRRLTRKLEAGAQ